MNNNVREYSLALVVLLGICSDPVTVVFTIDVPAGKVRFEINGHAVRHGAFVGSRGEQTSVTLHERLSYLHKDEFDCRTGAHCREWLA